MKIAILGATGRVGSRIMNEALSRGHTVVGIGGHSKGKDVPGVVFYQADMEDVDAIAEAISAAVLGGVSISGGTGKTSGVVTGVLVIGVLSQGLVMTGLSNNYQNMIKGAVLILAVILDTRSKMVKAKKA